MMKTPAQTKEATSKNKQKSKRPQDREVIFLTKEATPSYRPQTTMSDRLTLRSRQSLVVKECSPEEKKKIEMSSHLKHKRDTKNSAHSAREENICRTKKSWSVIT
jgi:hypothetical protein